MSLHPHSCGPQCIECTREAIASERARILEALPEIFSGKYYGKTRRQIEAMVVDHIKSGIRK